MNFQKFRYITLQTFINSTKEEILSNESKLDLDALDLHINNYVNGNNVSPSDLPSFYSAQGAEAVEEEHDHDTEDRHLHLESPFLAIQYKYAPADDGVQEEMGVELGEDEQLLRISEFQLNVVGVPENPQAVIQHLKHVIEHLESLESFTSNESE